jgi:hypothetical protein
MFSLLFTYLFSDENKDVHVKCLTYGSPRVGNLYFKEVIDNSPNVTHYRFFHVRDVVSYWPFNGYYTSGIGIKIDDNTIEYDNTNYSLVNEFKNDTWNNVFSWLTVKEHQCLSYYNNIVMYLNVRL